MRPYNTTSQSLLFPAFSLCLAITILRIFYLVIGDMPLFFDEAQYWDWSNNLDWGFYSKPPMVAWMIGITTFIFGESEWAVRLSSPILHMLTAIVVYGIGDRLYTKEIGFYSALSYITLPAVTVSSSIVSTDPSLLLFFALALYCFVTAIKLDVMIWWVFAGIFAGLGMLSKYSMVIFAFSAFIYLISSPENRKWASSLGFWLAAFIAALIFLPNLLWNVDYGFVSFLHTKDNANFSGFSLHFSEMAEFFGAQFGVFGPIYFLTLCIMILGFKVTTQKEEGRLLLSFIAPLLLLILTIALFSRAHPNWAAPIYVPATVLVVACFMNHNRRIWIYTSIFINISAAIFFHHFDTISKLSGITLSGYETIPSASIVKDPFKRLRGWDKLGKNISDLRSSISPDAAIITDRRKEHAEFLYYVDPKPVDIIKWNPNGRIKDHYDLTTDITKTDAADFLYITQRSNAKGLDPFFELSLPLETLTIQTHKDRRLNYYVYLLSGFKGYETGLAAIAEEEANKTADKTTTEPLLETGGKAEE